MAKPAISVPAEALPMMPIDAVRPGMVGYGLSTFNGAVIERFPVEAVSIEINAGPKQSLIWVRCTDERMQKSGPVQGMSGSPIFLYPDAASAEADGPDGRGGLLIGAFAYGQAMTNDCMVGVQPIAYMRDVANRAELEPAPAGGAAAATASRDPLRPRRVSAGLTAARVANLPAPDRIGNAGLAADVLAHAAGDLPDPLRGPLEPTPSLHQPLSLPLQVGSRELAGWLTPLAQGMGLPLNATAATSAAEAPPHVDAAAVALQPGSALAVPLAFGDWMPSITGTVTDVLPDGTVLGFGHPMDGLGDTALPMATGYTHFIASLITISYKVSGALAVQGSLVQDESAAVAGLPGDAGLAYSTAPMSVSVKLPGHDERAYRYEVVNHPTYTPMVASSAALQSLTAVQSPALLTTTRLTGSLAFSDGTRFDLDSRIPFGQPFGVFVQLMPLLSVMVDNDFQPVELAGGDLRIEVTDGVDLASIVSASVQPATAEAGDKVTVTVELQPYGGERFRERVELEIPSDFRPGEYAIAVSDASQHLSRMLATRPDLTRVGSLEQLVDLYKAAIALPADRLYVDLLSQNETGFAIGRSELPTLPSSQRLLLGVPGSNAAATPILPMRSTSADTEEVIAGNVILTLNVADPLNPNGR